jgi:WhiB family redox-sensing transcriptional regulator
MGWNEQWAAAALCKQGSPDELFVRGAEQHKAKVICQACPVRTECLAEALDNRIEWGVWGGLTERERRAILRKRFATSHPDVPTAVLPALPTDVHDLDGLRRIGELLAHQD